MLFRPVRLELESAVEQWDTGYACMPSNFIMRKDSIYYSANADLVSKECAFIVRKQLDDGSFEIPWQWWTDYKEFELSKYWWKADFCIRNMRFLREFAEA